MKIKVTSSWDTSENITKRLLNQFKTDFIDLNNIEFVYDDNYDLIVYNNYITEQPKNNSVIFFHEPSWVGSHQKNFNDLNIKIFGYNKVNYVGLDIIEHPSMLFYGGRGPGSDNEKFWTYDNLINFNFIKNKNISSIISKINNFDWRYPTESLYNDRYNLIDFLSKKLTQIDYYGWTNNFNEKKDGLINYKFSICIENSSEINYISEKFFDCILTNTIPIYFGCKNIKKILGDRGYILLDNITSYDEIFERLNFINNNVDKIYYEELPYLLKIKEKYFKDLNLLKKIITCQQQL